MASLREVSSLPLAKSTIDELVKHGFRMASDLAGMKPLELCQEIKSFTPALALNVLNCVHKCSLPEEGDFSSAPTAAVTTSAKDLLMKMGIHRPLISFCKEIDTMLGGGVMMGQLTEFCGVPGVSSLPVTVRACTDTFCRSERLSLPFNWPLTCRSLRCLTATVVKRCI